MFGIVSIMLIIGIMVFICVYEICKVYKSYLYRLRNTENISNQIESWVNTYTKYRSYEREELFSPVRMKYKGLNMKDLDIEIIDYTAKVPWFLRV